MASRFGVPDVILLDLNMSVMDGWESSDKFLDIPSSEGIIIFVTTSSINLEDLDQIKNYQDINNYIVKPFSPSALDEIINRLKI